MTASRPPPPPPRRDRGADPAAAAATMATPPKSGVGPLYHRLGIGRVTAPTRRASARAAGVNTRAATSALPSTTATSRTTLMARSCHPPDEGWRRTSRPPLAHDGWHGGPQERLNISGQGRTARHGPPVFPGESGTCCTIATNRTYCALIP